VLASDALAQEVYFPARCHTSSGINLVPAAIVNDRHLISTGQPADVFEQALRRIAAGEV
jgi:predicted DsbA family dithiol-disulfide isomerase